MENIRQVQLDNFFRYLAVPSQSKAGCDIIPSSIGQMELAKVLKKELEILELENIILNDNAILTAKLKGNKENVASIGFVAHLDTVNIGLSDKINPQILKFSGADLVLNKEKNIHFKVSEHPEIAKYLDEEIIFTDGTSVLGADNKAAIATIMACIKHIKDNNLEHGDIYLAFVPDEEIGLIGAKNLDLSQFKPDFAYTIDCCELGEIVYETFNGGSAYIDIKGVTAHPMSAKNVLVNPILIATDIINSLDRQLTPECTEKKEGYFWVQSINANQSASSMHIQIRDHDKILYEKKKEDIKKIVEKAQKDNPRAEISLNLVDVYANIADSIKEDRSAIDAIYKAMENLNIKANTIAMRGSTDGSTLSSRGLLTPNYFTGAHNFHSIYEFLPLSSMHKCFDTTIEIIKIIAQK